MSKISYTHHLGKEDLTNTIPQECCKAVIIKRYLGSQKQGTPLEQK